MKKILSFIILVVSVTACNKDFLDKKPNKALVTPAALDDLQAILDNDQYLNNNYPSVQELAADNFYILDADYNALTAPTTKAAYSWSDDIFNEKDDNDWSTPYISVQYANIVLDALKNIIPPTADTSRYNAIKGSALFYRSWAFFWQAQVFGQPYDQATAATSLGIVLRFKPGFEETSVRSTVKETYDQVLIDAKTALRLLPLTQPYKTRPVKAAAYALLARIYLTMTDYTNAGLYADSCLQLHNTLLNFNTLNPSAANPVPRLNAEIIFQSNIINRTPFSTAAYKVDSLLYRSYATNDLRKTIYYKATGSANYFVGSFYGTSTPFAGLTTAEMLLIRAEANARAGNTMASMNDLNTLLQSRFRTGFFTPLAATSANNALAIILTERRKELVARGLRWSDLRRLNKEPQFAITLTRKISNTMFTLQPNDPRYTFTIPWKVIQLTGMPQTPR